MRCLIEGSLLAAGDRHCTDKLPNILTGSLLQQWRDATQGLEGQQKYAPLDR